jgi:hypothetical protein
VPEAAGFISSPINKNAYNPTQALSPLGFVASTQLRLLTFFLLGSALCLFMIRRNLELFLTP